MYRGCVEVHSDHKSLEIITRKLIHKATPHVKVLLLKLLRYDMNIKYIPGSQLYIADTLSRAYVNDD